MTGSATLTGRFSAAVGTACEASKTKPPYVLTDVIVDRLWVPFSPCGHRAPVFPSIASGYASPVWPPIPALPVTLRIASPCQLPASRPAPGVHPRKGAGYHKNSSTKAKIQNDGNRNVDRAVFGGGRDYTGGIKCYSLHRALTVGCKSPFSGSCPRQSPRAAGESVLV